MSEADAEDRVHEVRGVPPALMTIPGDDMASKKKTQKRRKEPKALDRKHLKSTHKTARNLVKATLELNAMPKDAAVMASVGAQLRQDGKWPPVNANVTMADYRYTVNSMTLFLAAVRLRLQSVGWAFDFTVGTAVACLPLNAMQVAGVVYAQTH